ncbi:endolytic transglycosylase MltG [Patescibacteria group bacterium]|nr:endolytic transglycosylase MltG [Patescibacteria group bacterium]
MKSFLKKVFFAALVLIIIALFYTYNNIWAAVDAGDTSQIMTTVNRGDTAKDIAKTLKKHDLIKNEDIFYLYIRVTGASKNIEAGNYNLSKSMNVPEIIEGFKNPVSSEVSITIQEGLTISQIDDKLVNMDLAPDGDFEAAARAFSGYDSYWFLNREEIGDVEFALEGYLYPDTYFVDGVNFDSSVLITKMLDNFDHKFETVRDTFKSQDRTLQEIITMASILQMEVRTPEDYGLISGILWKRLDEGWHIGADATIIYVTKNKDITYQDLEIDSPYNTRKFVGMPPGPISNPDIEHIEGTLNPVESDYWFYLTTLDTGEVKYARNNDEHNQNKATYL